MCKTDPKIKLCEKVPNAEELIDATRQLCGVTDVTDPASRMRDVLTDL